jgi:hypothetical protein
MMLPMASSKKNIKEEDLGSQEERGTRKEEKISDVKRGRKNQQNNAENFESMIF